MAAPDVLWSEWAATSALILRIWVLENAGGRALMVPVALALRAAPQAVQQQMLLDTLDTALVRSMCLSWLPSRGEHTEINILRLWQRKRRRSKDSKVRFCYCAVYLK